MVKADVSRRIVANKEQDFSNLTFEILKKF